MGCFLAAGALQAQTFTDDFESYTVGTALGPQSANWGTWSGAGGGTDDVNVITTDNHTPSGTKSLYFVSTSANGGPSDCVLPFGTTPLTTGQFTYTSWFKVPTGKTAYFNFQGNATMGNMYTLDCFMTATGALNINNSGSQMLATTHPVGAWFELSIQANLNTNHWELFIDGVSQGSWVNGINQVYAIDLYPADASASFWVDDVSYNVTPYTLPALNAAENSIKTTNTVVGQNGLVGQSRNIAIAVRNLGTTTINSFDLSVDLNGGTPVVQNVTGLALASLASTTVNITTPFILVNGTNTFRSIVSNVNGLGADGDAADDTIARSITPVVPAPGKMVAAEEGTGTWCQWCPRGAVYMDAMAEQYDGYFAGVAVHNNDPMEVTDYDAAMGGLIAGYPSALLDRQPEIDPSELEDNFLARIQVAPKAFLLNGAIYDSTTRVLRVSITSTMQSSISGNYKIACVLTEDDVTGVGSTWSQSNAYANNAAGPMGGFEALGNPVSYTLMHYNHVARVIKPSFAGQPDAFGASASSGQVFNHNFTFTLPAGWDASQIHIVGLFIDPAGLVDNASAATLAEAIATGFTAGVEVGGTTGMNPLPTPDAAVTIYPNPAHQSANIALNLKANASVQVTVYSVTGALLAKRDYGQLTGGMLLPVDLGNYESGMYFVHVSIDGNTEIKKLIKE